MLTITIDNHTIQVGREVTILEAARSAGIDIPTLCNDKRLSPFGACRICVVEVDPGNRLVAACHTKVLDNMAVRTKTEQVIQARKLNMELVLAHHPLDCLVCDRGGECDLQRVAFKVCRDVGDTLPRNRIVDVFGAKPMDIDLVDDRTIIERDLNKCILCRKCIRVCDEVMGVKAACYAGRGSGTQIGTFYGQALACEFCGQCVDICPVGALFNKLSKYKARVWETEEAHTICGFCSSGCSMVVRTKRGEMVRVLGDPTKGINDSNLCVKGRYGYDFLNSRDRLKLPLVRREGQLKEVSWDVAFAYAAEKLREVKEKDGSGAIGGVGSIWATNEENYVFQKFMRAGLGTNNIDTYARMGHAPSIPVLTETLGYPAATLPMDDFSLADLIVLIGCNVTESHPIVGLAIKKAVRKHNADLLVIDPQNIKMNRFSTHSIANNAGSNTAVLNGIMHLLLEKDKVDHKFIESRTGGFGDLKESLKTVTPAEVKKAGGVDREDLARAADIIGASEKIVFVYGMGLTQYTSGIETVRALVNLALLTGSFGREGAGIFPVRGHCNAQGACDMGVSPGFLPGYRSVSDSASREKFQEAWGHPVPDKPGMTLTEMIPAAEEGKIKTMVVMGEDIMVALPGRKRVENALKNLDFLAVSDLFLTETAKLADVVFPSRFLTEKDGCVTNTERRIQRVRAALLAHGEAKADWEIISGMSKALGYDMEYRRPSDIMQEISGVVPNYMGINYDLIEEGDRGFLWPINPETKEETRLLYRDGFPTGKARFQPVKIPKAKGEKKYPYNLMAGKVLYQFHTGSVSRRSNALSHLVAEPFVGIHPEDGLKIQVAEGSRVRISTQNAEVVAKAKFMKSLPVGTVFIPIHFDGTFNVLFELHSGEHTPVDEICTAQLSAG
jgi:formate dehydrogenase alpha subunit